MSRLPLRATAAGGGIGRRQDAAGSGGAVRLLILEVLLRLGRKSQRAGLKLILPDAFGIRYVRAGVGERARAGWGVRERQEAESFAHRKAQGREHADHQDRAQARVLRRRGHSSHQSVNSTNAVPAGTTRRRTRHDVERTG